MSINQVTVNSSERAISTRTLASLCNRLIFGHSRQDSCKILHISQFPCLPQTVPGGTFLTAGSSGRSFLPSLPIPRGESTYGFRRFCTNKSCAVSSPYDYLRRPDVTR